MGSCCTAQRLVAGVTFSPQSLEVSSFMDKGKGRPDQEVNCTCTKWCLQSWCSLLFLTSKCLLRHFFPRTLSPALETCSGRYSFSVIFLMMAGNLFACLLVGRNCFPCYLNIFFPVKPLSKIIRSFLAGSKFFSFISFTLFFALSYHIINLLILQSH